MILSTFKSSKLFLVSSTIWNITEVDNHQKNSPLTLHPNLPIVLIPNSTLGQFNPAALLNFLGFPHFFQHLFYKSTVKNNKTVPPQFKVLIISQNSITFSQISLRLLHINNTKISIFGTVEDLQKKCWIQKWPNILLIACKSTPFLWSECY